MPLLPVGLLPHIDELSVENVIANDQMVTLFLAAREPIAACPRCDRCSDRVHSQYQRTLHDLPIGPNVVTLQVRVRRFRCISRDCSQKVFAERFPKLGRIRARRTHGQEAALEEVGFALGGAAGARLAKRVRFPASRSTILRLVHAAKDPAAPTPRVLGVDDWARRRGQTYGTILIDLERHRPIDLLKDRTAESFEAWLRQHPGVEVIARDRGGAYADGARKGAPKAVQVADRYHLLVNIGDVLERLLARKHACLKEAAAVVSCLAAGAQALVEPEPTPVEPMPTVTRCQTRVEQGKQARRARRLARYEAIVELHQQGKSLRAIAEELRISRATVRRFIRADGFPERAKSPLRPTSLTPYESYLRERWTAGCQNARVLWEEIQALGFQGALVTVRRWVGGWRASPGRRGPTSRKGRPVDGKATPPPPKPTRVLSPRQARWLLLRPVDDLRPEEQAYRHELLQEDEIQRGQSLTEDFGRLVRERDRAALMPWLSRAEESGLGEYREFAIVLRRDLAAVEAALTHEWSNGQTEGQINRLKMLKRQMFGRASLSLLRRRFLRAA